MNNKVALALLSEAFTTLKSISNLIVLLWYVFLIFLQQHSDFFAVTTLGSLIVFSELIKMNALKRLFSCFLRRYNIYTPTHIKIIYLTYSSIKRRSV